MSALTKNKLPSPSHTAELFFDAVDSFCITPDFNLVHDDFQALFCWRNQLLNKSVEERRHVFFHKMGFVDHSDHLISGVLETERVRESSTQTSSSSSSHEYASGSEIVFTSTDTQCHAREQNGKANSLVNESEMIKLSTAAQQTVTNVNLGAQDITNFNSNTNKMLNWWTNKIGTTRKVMNAIHKRKHRRTDDTPTPTPSTTTTKVQLNKKRVKQLSAMYLGQQFQAHKGAIWVAKLSPDGKYLASGGQDGVVRVWHLSSADSHDKSFGTNSCSGGGGGNRFSSEKKVLQVPVMIPDKVFHIVEEPVHEFHGHSADILDLDWSSTSNRLLSSSVDNTARLWEVGSSECVNVFQHPDFVTCVQFNPVDNGHFVSGSVDGKIRVWGVSEGRVKDWDDIRDSVTTISYQPDGQGLAVGSLNGVCRLYESSGGSVQLISQIQVGASKRSSSGNRITGIQFLPEDSQKVMVTCEDSKIRVMDKMNIIHKYRGFCGSGCQMSASFTHNQRHITSIGEDSRVYLWDYDSTPPPTTPESAARHSTKIQSVRTCESFHSKGVSVAVPWSFNSWCQANSHCLSSSIDSSLPVACLSNLFPTKQGSVRVSATWPEELLPQDDQRSSDCGCCYGSRDCSPAWGLVIVTGSLDGTIRAFHNYGLPIRV